MTSPKVGTKREVAAGKANLIDDVGGYDVVDQNGPFRLLERTDGKRTVVQYSDYQVYSAMPGDQPQGGGQWFARATRDGVNYVASWYSAAYANRMFNSLIAGER